MHFATKSLECGTRSLNLEINASRFSCEKTPWAGADAARLRVPRNDTLRAQQRRQKEAKVHPERAAQLVTWLLTQSSREMTRKREREEIVTCTAAAGDKEAENKNAQGMSEWDAFRFLKKSRCGTIRQADHKKREIAHTLPSDRSFPYTSNHSFPWSNSQVCGGVWNRCQFQRDEAAFYLE